MELQPLQFYHGTIHKFDVGDEVTPAVARGAKAQFGVTDPNYAYSTTSHKYASMIASTLGDSRGAEPHVYEVEHSGHMEHDPIDNRPHAYRSKNPMRVVREVPMWSRGTQ